MSGIEKEHFTCGGNFKKCRENAGITQEILAEKTGLSTKYIGAIENNRSRPALITVEKIANALGVGLDTLLYGSVNNTDDYFFTEAARLRSQMTKKQRIMADNLGLKILEEILKMSD